MATHRQVHEESGKKKPSPDLKIIVIGIVMAMIILSTGVGGESNVADPIVSDNTIAYSQPQDLITVLATQAQSVIASLTAQPTLVPQAPSADVAMATAIQDAAASPGLALMANSGTNAVPLIQTGTAGVDQYTIRTTDKLPTQEEKEAAAANYKEIREAYLKTGIPSLQGDFQIAAAFNGTARPVMDPGGVPHYFGPYPNWANSPMPMGSISNITIDNPGRFYTGNATVTITDAYFTGSGATATATRCRGCHQ